ncbi:hypothetical protein ACPW7J_02315 [Ihubacter sp. rT4E-8]|uniref:hypothetical protein n=1 Tax=Ihubacter sp. rT4E-8 TaxID=3242369 RepID=UPI003CF0FF57
MAISSEEFSYFNRNKEKLYKLLVHCKLDIPYYSDKLDLPTFENFSFDFFRQRIPVLRKNILRADSRILLDKHVKDEQLYTDATSGTEGKPILCYRSKAEEFICSSTQWTCRRNFVSDLTPKDRFAHFYAFRDGKTGTISNRILYHGNEILLPIFELSEQHLMHIWNEIFLFKPRWIHGTVSNLYGLAVVVNKFKLKRYSFDLIELVGEYVSDSQKEYIERTFGSPVAIQYGSREYWPIAYSTKDGKLEVNSNVFIETISGPDGADNRLLITLLKNDAWPLIRYDIGDCGLLHYDNEKIFVKLLKGRSAEFISFSQGKIFNTIVFSSLIRKICGASCNNVIRQYQVIKEDNDRISILLCTNPLVQKEDICQQIKFELSKILGEGIQIEVKLCDYIQPDSFTGKTKNFIDKTIV